MAAHAKVGSLERQMRELERENERLRAKDGASSTGKPSSTVVWILLGIVALLSGAAFISGFVVSGYEGEQVGIVLLALAFVAAIVASWVAILRALLVVVRPNELAILSGRAQVDADGRTRGYRIVYGGRVLRMPILETLDRLDTTPIAFELALHSAAIGGAGKIDVVIKGRVRISRREPLVQHAVERFLGKSRDDVASTATEILDRVVRDVLVTLIEEILREDRARVQSAIREEAEADLERIGLELDEVQLVM